MDKVFDASQRLSISMGEMLGLLRALTESAQKKETLIIAGDTAGLEAVLQEEAETASEFKQKEKELRYRADGLRRAAGLDGKNVKLKEICGLAGDAAWRERLTGAADDLAAVLERLALLKQRIGYADYMLNFLHAPDDRFSSYNMLGGKEGSPESFSLLDCHV
mgnify:CR=1 FL=1